MTNVDSCRVCRYARQGIFERHKPLLSLHLTASVSLADEQISRREYRFLFDNFENTEQTPRAANPDPDWITPSAWNLICKVDELDSFQGLQASIDQNIRQAKYLPSISFVLFEY